MLCISAQRGIAGLLTAISLFSHEVALPDLPEVNTARFLPVVRQQIGHAVSDARERPRDPKVVGALGMTLQAYQLNDAAARAYSRACVLEPQSFDWVYLLGVVQAQLGVFEEAEKSFQSALQIRPSDFPAELRAADAQMKLAKWDQAKARYQAILTARPDSAQAWYGVGRTYAAKGDGSAAAKAYSKAIEMFPQYGAAHFALAGELRKLGQADKAKDHLAIYSQNASIDPPLDDAVFARVRALNQSATNHIHRAMELEKTGKLSEAILEHEAALSSDPTNVQVHINLISLYGRTGNPEKAKEHFEASVRQNADRADAWYNYGVLLLYQQNDREAEKAFVRTITINPYYAEAHHNLGVIFQQRGQLDVAAKEFRQAIADQPNYPLARFQLGRILVNQNRYAEAIEQFLKTLEPADEKTPTYLYALGSTYARAGDRERALQYLRQAREAAIVNQQAPLQASIERDLVSLQK